MKKKRLPPPDHFLNRELGLLAFNMRVLEEAENRKNPLLERLRFLCIVSSNLDEFFEIRVGGLKEQITLGAAGAQPDGISPRQLFPLVAQLAHELFDRQYRLLNDEMDRGNGGIHALQVSSPLLLFPASFFPFTCPPPTLLRNRLQSPAIACRSTNTAACAIASATPLNSWGGNCPCRA